MATKPDVQEPTSRGNCGASRIQYLLGAVYGVTRSANSSSASDLVHRRQYRRAFVLDEEHDEFCRLSLAGVPPNDVDVIRPFIEGLTGCQTHFLSAPHLHHDGTFQHINKPMCIVAMDW